jgi:spore maturation protein CgeB
MKSVLIVGNSDVWSIETHYAKYLLKYGFKIDFFTVGDYYKWDLSFKIRIKLGDLSVFNLLNQTLIDYCNKFKPDIIWVFKGFEVFPETIDKLSKMGCYLANFNPDHPFIRTSIMHGGKNIPKSIPLYDMHFAYSQQLVHKINLEYKKKCNWLPFGYEFDPYNFGHLQLIEERVKLCFIGTPDRERSKLLIELAQKGFEIDIYSLTYPYENQLRKEQNITLYPVVTGIAFWENIRKYRVQLNFLREHNKGSHNQRTFEVPGVGGVLLTEYSEEQSHFFDENREIFMFKDFEDLVNKAQSILNMENKDIIEVRKRCMGTSIANGYNYECRTKIVINEFMKI